MSYPEWERQMRREEEVRNLHNIMFPKSKSDGTVRHYESELNALLDSKKKMTRHLLIILGSALPYIFLIVSCFFVRNLLYSVSSVFLGLSIPFGIYIIVCKYFEYHDKIKKVTEELRESEIEAAKRYLQQQESQGDKPW